jgi:helicase required for RNAi-mediated heterochromatin assembly 1
VELLEPFQLERRGEPLPVEAFVQHGLLTEEQLETLEDGVSGWVDTEDTGIGNPLTDWLGDQGRPFKVDYTSEAVECAENEIDMEYEQLMELEAEQGLGTDEAVLRGTYISLDSSYRGIRSSASSIREAVLQEFIKAPDLFKIPVTSRGAVYNYLRALLHDRVQCKLREAARQYKTFTEQLLIGKWERDEQILRDARLIGMTTTGLSKYRGLVSSLKPRIVLIEEAAEVIEAPAAVACFESVQQLILVGDHQQLKGHCALHDLEGAPFYLDMSMFERLVRNNFPYTMLREQRRMAPEICELLTPIYGVLVNHASVQKYPLIPGMGKIRSWFFNHHWPESGDSLSSKTNEMEAIVVSELYAYLLMNGVNTRGITVLTFYNGQRKLLLKNMKLNPYLRNHYPNVMTIDSYQGEENDVVLLSLVRSNDRGNLGFVGVENRACVALSRAKHGFFIFGNADCLVAGSKLWTKVASCMSSNNRLAAVLPLTCQNHNRQTLITGELTC